MARGGNEVDQLSDGGDEPYATRPQAVTGLIGVGKVAGALARRPRLRRGLGQPWLRIDLTPSSLATLSATTQGRKQLSGVQSVDREPGRV